MKRSMYQDVVDGKEDGFLLDDARKIFVEGVEVSFSKRDREYAVGEANRLWESCYRERAKIRLGLK